MSSNTSLRRTLRTAKEINSLSSQAMDELAAQMKLRVYKADDVILRTKQPIDFLGIIQSGEIVVEYRQKNTIIYSFTLGTGNMILKNLKDASVEDCTIILRSKTDTRLYTISNDQLAQYLQHPIPTKRMSALSRWALFSVLFAAILFFSGRDMQRIVSSSILYLSSHTGIAHSDQERFMQLLYYSQLADKSSALPYIIEGNILFAEQDLSNAFKAFEIATSIDHQNSYALNNLATTYFGINDFSNALRFQQEAARNNPNNAIIHYNLGIYLVENGDAENAIIAFKEATHITPNWHLPYIQLASLYSQGQNYSLAEENALHAIEINSNEEISYLLLAVAQYNQGKYTLALSSLENLLQINPNSDLGKFYKALTLIELDKLEDALGTLIELQKNTINHDRITRIKAEIENIQRKIQNPEQKE